MSDESGAEEQGRKGGADDSDERPECFVIMPFTEPEGYKSGHFGRVFDALFAPACEKAGYRAVRADHVSQTNLIHLDLLQRLLDSPLVLCDLSGRNPNVLFELGLRQAFDRPVVLVQEVGAPPIFDIGPLRIKSYRPELYYQEVLEDQRAIAAAISATAAAEGDASNVNSIVRLLGLTRSASLPLAEGDETLTLLRVIMREVGALKSEVSTMRSRGLDEGYAPEASAPRFPSTFSFAGRYTLDRFIEMVNQGAMIDAIVTTFMVPRRYVRRALLNAPNFDAFIETLVAESRIQKAVAQMIFGNLREKIASQDLQIMFELAKGDAAGEATDDKGA